MRAFLIATTAAAGLLAASVAVSAEPATVPGAIVGGTTGAIVGGPVGAVVGGVTGAVIGSGIDNRTRASARRHCWRDRGGYRHCSWR